MRAMVAGWRGARSQRLLFSGASVSLAAKLRLKVPHQSVLLELGTLPFISNTLQGLCMQMEKGRCVGAGREGRGGERE